MSDVQISVTEADVQIAVIDQENTQLALAAPDETQVSVAVPGVQGPKGEGVPIGGSANQVLFKQSGTNYDTAWGNVTSAMIGDLQIVDADIATNAEIAVSKLADGAARQLLQTDAAGTGVEWASNIDIPGTLDVTGAATFDSTTSATGTSTAASFIPTSSTAPTNGLYLSGTNTVGISTNSTGRLFITSAGKILIGYTSDQSSGNLQVSGTARIGGFDFGNTANELIYVDGASMGVGTYYSFPLYFKTNNIERMRLDSSGRLGLGTSAPWATLSVGFGQSMRFGTAVDGSGNPALDLYRWQGSGTAYKSARILCLTDGSIGILNATANSTDFSAQSFTERVRITAAGAVGIGTTSPQDKLHIDGAGRQSVRISNVTPGSAASPELTTIDFYGWQSRLKARIEAQDQAGNFNGGWLALSTENSSNVLTKALTIDNQQRVGIGTTSPGQLLHLTQTSAGAAVDCLFLSNLSVSANTSVGISFGPNVSNTVDRSAVIRGINESGGVGNATGLQFLTNANGQAPTEKARLDASGRLLVGTSTSPSAGSGQFSLAVIQGYVGAPQLDGSLSIQRGEGAATITSGEELGGIYFNDNAGNTFANIKVSADANAGAGDYPGRIVFATTSDSAASPTERLRVNSSGNMLLGLTADLATTHRFAVQTSNLAVGINTTNGGNNEAMRFYNAGTAVGTISTTGTATAYNTSSDYRLKENVIPLTGAIDRINDLQVHRFNFIADPDKTVDGFLAHEAQDVVPECVTGTKDEVDADGNPVYQGIDQSKLVPLLTAALQEAIAKIEVLEAKVATLEGV